MIISDGKAWLNIDEVQGVFTTVSGKTPLIRTIKFWRSKGLIEPVLGCDIPEWKGSHRSAFFDSKEVYILAIKYGALTVPEAHKVANKISPNKRTPKTIRKLVADGVIKSEPSVFEQRGWVRIRKDDLSDAINELDKGIMPPSERTERFIQMVGVFEQSMTRRALAGLLGIHSSLIPKYESNRVPSQKIIDKMIELLNE